MRIYSISNSVNFGYNKELNQTVNNKLKHAKGNKEYADILLRENQLIMDVEDKLRKAEKEKNYFLQAQYTDILMSNKTDIVSRIEDRFPKMNYRKLETESYKKEIKARHLGKDQYHWLNELVDNLVVSDILDKEMKESIDNYNKQKEEEYNAAAMIELEAKAENSKQTNNNTKKADFKAKNKTCKFIEKFEPTEYSPKGFVSLGGMDEIKNTLSDKIIHPLLNPEEAKLDEVEYGLKAPRGELFYGPPGCGKTSIMEAVSMESGLPLFKLKVSKAGSIFVNGSSKNVQEAYDYVKKYAKDSGMPVFLAIDEMESMTAQRDGKVNEETQKLVDTLLQIIEDARGNNVIILGATNHYDMVDDAVKSRMDDKIYIGLPDDETRRDVLKICLNRTTKGQALASNDEELNKVVKLTKGFSNRDITILTDKAARIARADNRRDIIADDYIVPVKENQNMKVKEDLYQDKSQRPIIGFSNRSGGKLIM